MVSRLFRSISALPRLARSPTLILPILHNNGSPLVAGVFFLLLTSRFSQEITLLDPRLFKIAQRPFPVLDPPRGGDPCWLLGAFLHYPPRGGGSFCRISSSFSWSPRGGGKRHHEAVGKGTARRWPLLVQYVHSVPKSCHSLLRACIAPDTTHEA